MARYDLSESSFSDLFSHLDSIDINEKNAEEFEKEVKMDESLEREGLRCSVTNVLKYFQEKHGMDSQDVWKQIESAVVKSVLCAENFITAATQKKLKYRKTAFHLLGFDILIDSKFKVWVLEINHVPSMSPHTNLENKIKLDMLSDLYNTVDVLNRDRDQVNNKAEELWALIKDKVKRDNLQPSLNPQERFNLENLLLLDKTDVWTLVDFEMEVTPTLKFCFPLFLLTLSSSNSPSLPNIEE